MAVTELSALIRGTVAAYLCLYAPAQAWLEQGKFALQRPLAVIAASLAWTSFAGLTLAAAGCFSINALLIANAAATAVGLIYSRLFERHRRGCDNASSATAGPASSRRLPALRRPLGAGVLLVVLALSVYWPPYDTLIGAGDSSAYLATGLHLANSGSMQVPDDLGPQVPPLLARLLFRSADPSHVWPPYARSPGALAVSERGAAEAHPMFFPLPAVWAAIGSSLGGAEYAPAYAPLFSALALWPLWIFMRRRMSALPAVVAISTLALNAAYFWSARLALSEPLATFFLWAGLAALDAWATEKRNGDASLAAVLLGMTIVARSEFVVLVGGALLLRSLAGDGRGPRRLPLSFYACLALALATCAALQTALPGTYTAPLTHALGSAVWGMQRIHANTPLLLPTVGLLSLLAALLAARRFGVKAVIACAILTGGLGGYFWTSHFLWPRSLMWVGMYLGWPAIIAAVAGFALLAIDRGPGNREDAFFAGIFALAAVMLLYNPHVYPFLPWAARRFVPLLLPGLAVFAGVTLQWLWSRSRPASLAAAILVMVFALLPTQAIWGKRFFEGSSAQLTEIAEALPPDGTLLISAELGPYMLGPALWLVHGRNNLSVHPDWMPPGRREIQALTRIFSPQGPVYLMTPAAAEKPPIAGIKRTLADSFDISQRLLEQTHYRLPRYSETQHTSIALHRLDLLSGPRLLPKH